MKLILKNDPPPRAGDRQGNAGGTGVNLPSKSQVRDRGKTNEDATILSIGSISSARKYPKVNISSAPEAREISRDIAYNLTSPLINERDKEVQIDAASGGLDENIVFTLLSE